MKNQNLSFIIFIPFIILQICLLTKCIDFEYSPFQTNMEESEKGLTNKNLQKLLSLDTPVYPFKIAVISDTHHAYNDFKKLVNHINNQRDLKFLIVVGDMTNIGLLKEYKWTYQIISKLNIPYFTVIGNHDSLSNGKQIYKDMFGDYNYVFVYGNMKFIFFNDNKLEFQGNVPDYYWLQSQLSDNYLYDHVIVISHVPPFSREVFNIEEENKFRNILKDNNVTLSIHGHIDYHHEVKDDVAYIIIGNIHGGNHIIFEFEEDGFEFKRQTY